MKVVDRSSGSHPPCWFLVDDGKVVAGPFETPTAAFRWAKGG